MSKYKHFFNMKSYAFLIILGLIPLVYSNHDLNISNTLNPECTDRKIRRKRANTDYTLWGNNQEELTTGVFLVKVLDDDFITSQTKPIVAVNILPATRADSKIIIGGVNIPPRSSMMSIGNDQRDYTRFEPATAEANAEAYPLPLNTVDSTVIQPLQPQGYYSQRDDSPPVSPQFITGTPVLVARQYAPLEPVAFSPRGNPAPLTAPTNNNVPFYHGYATPHRTNTQPEPTMPLPVRTKSDYEELNSNQQDDEIASRTTYTKPIRTTLFEFSSSPEVDFLPTTKPNIDISKHYEQIKKIAEKDESSYNMMFYSDEDVISNKKEDQEGLDIDLPEMPDSHNILEDTEYKNENVKELPIYMDDDEIDNTTQKSLSKDIVGVPSLETATMKSKSDTKTREKRRPTCDLLKLRKLNFNSPRTLPEINSQLKTWAEDSPVAKWVDITDGNLTTMENPIHMMIVDDPSSGQIVTAKQTVMIVAGIQGRDHNAVAAAMYVLYQLIERSDVHSDLLTKYRFWIIPVFNPDGYDYSMTFPHRRGWSKNLRQEWHVCKGREQCKACETHGLRCTIQPCYGVNLDRNFEYQWIPADEVKSEPCGDLYAGSRQLSEIETRALTQYLHEQHTPLFTFIAFKEGNILGVMYPYSHTKKRRAFDHIYRQRATRAASAASAISNRHYVAGQTSEFLPLYAGGIEDWIDGHLGIDNTYTIMMFRPSDARNVKLITEHIVRETYAAMDTLLLQSLEPLGPAPVILARTKNSHQILPTQTLYIVTVYINLLLNS